LDRVSCALVTWTCQPAALQMKARSSTPIDHGRLTFWRGPTAPRVRADLQEVVGLRPPHRTTRSIAFSTAFRSPVVWLSVLVHVIPYGIEVAHLHPIEILLRFGEDDAAVHETKHRLKSRCIRRGKQASDLAEQL